MELKRIISHREGKFEEFFFFRSLKYTLIQLHSVSGILGYKINFDTNGDVEFNLTLLDMQPIGKLMFGSGFFRGVWKGISGIRDFPKKQCWIRETLTEYEI